MSFVFITDGACTVYWSIPVESPLREFVQLTLNALSLEAFSAGRSMTEMIAIIEITTKSFISVNLLDLRLRDGI